MRGFVKKITNLPAIKRMAAIILAAALLCSCGTETGDSPMQKPENKKIQIGMSFDSFVIERWQRDRDIFVSVAKDLGAEVNVQDAGGVVAEQKRQIEYFINKGVDAIVIIGIDPKELEESVKKAHDAGIKVIAYDRLITNAPVDLYISFDNEMVGTLMGRELAMAGIYGQSVIILGGSPTDNNVSMVEKGFMNVMDINNVKILDIMHADGWKAELAADYIYSHPDKIRETDAIMCGNDDIATQVVRALAVSRRAGDILVTGQDADLAACQRIVEGTQLMTVYKPVEKLATRAAEETVALIKGEKLSGDDVGEIVTGPYKVPYIGLEPVSVTKDNIDEVIIGSGFHLKEDVYLNVQ